MTTYTFCFQTLDSDGEVSSFVEYPFKGFANEQDAYEAFENMPEYSTDSEGNDYWSGELIGDVIETKESI